MHVKTILVGDLSVNCYIVSNDKNECVIIDAGGNASKISSYIEESGLLPKAILLTHSHFDHILAVPELVDKFTIPLAVFEDEAELLSDGKKNLSTMLRGRNISLQADVLLKDNEEYFGLKVLHTPGHTKGGVCFYSQEDGILFSGDTLFNGSIGRSDFYTGDHDALISSIKSRLLMLPDETAVYPGHGPQTTIAYEKKYNPFLI